MDVPKLSSKGVCMSKVIVGNTSALCDALHRIVQPVLRHCFQGPGDSLPENGVYFVFEEGEQGHGGDRIVRVGCHTGDGNLPARLREHVTLNKDRSIFRKHLGRSLLRRESDPYLRIWEIDFTSRSQREKLGHLRDAAKQVSVEDAVSAHIARNMRFAVVPFGDPKEALQFERLSIATVANCGMCRPSANWLGKHSPSDKIGRSGMWQQQYLRSEPLSVRDLEGLSIRLGGQPA
jgi:hypothetical protein